MCVYFLDLIHFRGQGRNPLGQIFGRIFRQIIGQILDSFLNRCFDRFWTDFWTDFVGRFLDRFRTDFWTRFLDRFLDELQTDFLDICSGQSFGQILDTSMDIHILDKFLDNFNMIINFYFHLSQHQMKTIQPKASVKGSSYFQTR